MNTKSHIQKLINILVVLALLTSTAIGSAMPFKAQTAMAADLEAFPDGIDAVGTPTIDGVIDDAYGDPLTSDPADTPQGNANMDLLDLYVLQDDTYFYFAFSVNDNIESCRPRKDPGSRILAP